MRCPKAVGKPSRCVLSLPENFCQMAPGWKIQDGARRMGPQGWDSQDGTQQLPRVPCHLLSHLLPLRGGGEPVPGLFPGNHRPDPSGTTASGCHQPMPCGKTIGWERTEHPQRGVSPTRCPHTPPHLPQQGPGEWRLPGCRECWKRGRGGGGWFGAAPAPAGEPGARSMSRVGCRRRWHFGSDLWDGGKRAWC